jgi:hypothetical protein
MVTLHIEGEWEHRLEKLSGLDGTPKEELARRLLQKGLEQELAELRAQVQTVADLARAGGPSRELTGDDWAEIMAARPEDVDPNSLAVPPGWRPKKS